MTIPEYTRRSLLRLLSATVLASALITFVMSSHALEEPDYQVIRTLADKQGSQPGNIEIRQYAVYTVAEVVVAGPAAEAGNQAFPILAGYIFGKNKGERKFAMTVPATQAAVPVKLEMTAPVTLATTTGGFLVQFVLPRGVTVATAPEPLDARVRLREVPAAQIAAIRYSGLWSESNSKEHLDRLQEALRVAGLAWAGEPVVSRYNAPWTPWFMRRNEVWLPLAVGAAP